MSRRTRALIAGVALAAIAVAIGICWKESRTPARRSALADAAPGTPLPPGPALAELSVEQWTPRLLAFHQAQAWDELRAQLEQLRSRRAAEFARFRLGYLLARVLLEVGELDAAERELAPFLAEGDPFALRARRHAIEIQEARGNLGDAARLRHAYILATTDPVRRAQEIETQLDYLQENDPAGLLTFVAAIRPSAATALRRELDARQAEALLALDREGEANALALRLIRGGTADDPAERALRVLDRPVVIGRLAPDDLIALGEAARDHRHYERGIELLRAARARAPRRSADLRFAIGRCWFGSENFEEAEKTYLAGAAETKDREQEATFWFHAARAAQLTGDDDRAMRHMTRAIAVPGRFGSTAAALTQRMRTRAKLGDLEGAQSDLRQLERLFPRGDSRVEAAVQLATYLLAAGRAQEALRELDGIPRGADAWSRAEIAYWRARALEASAPERALDAYLTVLRAEVPTHHAYFARERLRAQPLAPLAAKRLAEARAAADAAIARGAWGEARVPATTAVLLSTDPPDRERLRRVYDNLDAYRAVLELEPEPLPSFPLEEEPDAADLLMAMGLFDETQAEIERRWELRPMRAALTRAHALNLAAASRESIYAIEVMMRSVPDDYVPELLPRRVRELLYPRYFEPIIRRDAARYGADPYLVLSIMREESRFDPRAKSLAAARGLLQFIITTARDIGSSLGLVDLDSRDLYDPRTIIQLGAKYVADLLEEFDGSRYRAVAAYNAGPYQTRLWSRIAPAPDDDYFLTSVNFAETKHYVRKVLNSYERYGEIYGDGEPVGGVRAEP